MNLDGVDITWLGHATFLFEHEGTPEDLVRELDELDLDIETIALEPGQSVENSRRPTSRR